MKITSIAIQQKNTDRYSIFVDGEYSFSLSSLELLESKLKKDQELTQEEIRKLKELSEIGKFYGRTLDLIARRPRSAQEIRTYLKGKKLADEDIEQIIIKLESRGYLNDPDFARRWVESRNQVKPTSKRILAQELKQKGLASEIIDDVTSEGQVDDLGALKRVIETKQKQSRYQDKSKLMQYLARKGFNYSDIKKVLESDETD
jgi:regulatory protein